MKTFFYWPHFGTEKVWKCFDVVGVHAKTNNLQNIFTHPCVCPKTFHLLWLSLQNLVLEPLLGVSPECIFRSSLSLWLFFMISLGLSRSSIYLSDVVPAGWGGNVQVEWFMCCYQNRPRALWQNAWAFTHTNLHHSVLHIKVRLMCRLACWLQSDPAWDTSWIAKGRNAVPAKRRKFAALLFFRIKQENKQWQVRIDVVNQRLFLEEHSIQTHRHF